MKLHFLLICFLIVKLINIEYYQSLDIISIYSIYVCKLMINIYCYSNNVR